MIVRVSQPSPAPARTRRSGCGSNDSTANVWDTKRQVIWLVVGVSFGTFIVYLDSRDEGGRFDGSVFAFWEIVLLAIILTLFYIYSRKKS